MPQNKWLKFGQWYFCVSICLSGCSQSPPLMTVPHVENDLNSAVAKVVELKLDGVTIENNAEVRVNDKSQFEGRLIALEGRFNPGSPQIVPSSGGRLLADNYYTCFVRIMRINDANKTSEVMAVGSTNQNVEQGGKELAIHGPINQKVPAGEYWLEVNLVEKEEGGIKHTPAGIMMKLLPICRERFRIVHP